MIRNLMTILAQYYSFLFIFCLIRRMNGLRKLQFAIKGYFNFTKRSEPLPALQGTLEGKNFVITGANSGIGYAAAHQAAVFKANVYLLCRDAQRGEAARKKIAEQSNNPNIFLILCELGEI